MRLLTDEPIHPLWGTAPTVIAPMLGRPAGQRHLLGEPSPPATVEPSRRPMMAPLPDRR